jgi:flagellar protein FliS
VRHDPGQYTQRAVETASPGQLVVMLYDGLIRFLGQAKAAMERGQAGEAGLKLSRAQAIVTELRVSLDMTRGPIASNLAAIYDWGLQEMTQARLANDPERIAVLVAQFADLREAWAAVATTARPAEAAAQARRPVVGVNLAG